MKEKEKFQNKEPRSLFGNKRKGERKFPILQITKKNINFAYLNLTSLVLFLLAKRRFTCFLFVYFKI